MENILLTDSTINVSSVCECKCGQLVNLGRKFIHGHNTSKIHQEKIIKYCECNCGQICNNRFVSGHNAKIMNLGRKFIYTEDDKKTWHNICGCGCGKRCKQRFCDGHYAGRKGKISWNKGLTKETNESIAKAAEKIKIAAAHNWSNPIFAEKTIAKITARSGQRRFSFNLPNGIIIKMRSSWEIQYAEHLNSLGIIWQYEPRSFLLSTGHRYFPDFYLPELNEWHEIKGWMSPESQEKIDLFQKEYPDEKLIIIREVPK